MLARLQDLLELDDMFVLEDLHDSDFALELLLHILLEDLLSVHDFDGIRLLCFGVDRIFHCEKKEKGERRTGRKSTRAREAKVKEKKFELPSAATEVCGFFFLPLSLSKVKKEEEEKKIR